MSYDIKKDAGKIRMGLMTCQFWAAIKGVAAVLTYGATKYPHPETGDRGWYQPQNRDTIPRYNDAHDRHMTEVRIDIELCAANDGQWPIGRCFAQDEETGQLHIDQAITNLLFLRELMYGKNFDINEE